MSARPKWTEEAKQKFLDVLRETGNVTQAAQSLNLGRSTAYVVRYNDPEFAEAWDEAAEESADRLEYEAWRRAFYGYNEPVFYKGQQVGVTTKYSDRLLERLLEARKPEQFKRRNETALTGKDGGPVQVENKTNEQLDADIIKYARECGIDPQHFVEMGLIRAIEGEGEPSETPED